MSLAQKLAIICLAAAAFLLLFATPVTADHVVEVDAGNMQLADIWPEAPADVALTDLGPAPPAGSSRLLHRKELQRRLSAVGIDAGGLSLPVQVRVKTRSEQWDRKRLGDAATSLAVAQLPAGVELKKAETRVHLVTPRGTAPAALELSHIPRRAGQARLSATLTLEYDGEVVQRVPISLTLDIDESATVPDVKKGALLRIYIDKSSARITAQAIALTDAYVGETVQFRVQATRRVVRAVVESAHFAKVTR